MEKGRLKAVGTGRLSRKCPIRTESLFFSGGRAFERSLSITHNENDGQVLEDCVDWDFQELLLEIRNRSQKGKSHSRFRSIFKSKFPV